MRRHVSVSLRALLALLAAFFLAGTIIAAVPELHAALHSDGAPHDDNCFVALIASGVAGTSLALLLVAAVAALRDECRRLPPVPDRMARAFFDRFRVLEHAPPSAS